MKNRYGVDVSYVKNLTDRITRDFENYKPDELAREFARLSKTIDSNVLSESEFNDNWIPIEDNTEFKQGKNYIVQIRGEVTEAYCFDDKFYWNVTTSRENRTPTTTFITHRSAVKYYQLMPEVKNG